MATNAQGRPIIIKKKKVSGHGGHHGGAWKVAFADFMTAMMAFFLVMWILGLSESTRKGISGYFKEPGIFSFTSGKAMPMEIQTVPSIHRGDGSGEAAEVKHDAPKTVGDGDVKNAVAQVHAALAKLAKDEKQLAKLEKAVRVEITEEGLRLELEESPDMEFFDVGGASPAAITRQVLASIAPELKKIGRPLHIEGHTDSRPYGGKAGYTNWDLSADRANAARRILADGGVPSEQIKAVTGYADRRLRKPDAPMDISNRRVSIVVEFPKETASTEAKEKPKASRSSAAPVFFPISPTELEGAYKQQQ